MSRCLLGECCRYDGGSKPSRPVQELCARPDVEAVGICPECAGGLPTPRLPSERMGERVLASDGGDVTDAFWRGAEAELARCEEAAVELAILKERSPSCGVHMVYDGTHSGAVIEGRGVLSELLVARGVTVVSEEDVADGLSLEMPPPYP